MPGPNEMSLSINSYLSPLVEELKEFWKGVLIPVTCNGITLNVNVRLAITCVSCDIPASRHTSKQEGMWISGTLCQIGM